MGIKAPILNVLQDDLDQTLPFNPCCGPFELYCHMPMPTHTHKHTHTHNRQTSTRQISSESPYGDGSPEVGTPACRLGTAHSRTSVISSVACYWVACVFR